MASTATGACRTPLPASHLYRSHFVRSRRSVHACRRDVAARPCGPPPGRAAPAAPRGERNQSGAAKTS